MSTPAGHGVQMECPLREDDGRLVLGVEWVARCLCGRTSANDGTPDGTLASAREWADAHLREALGVAPAPPAGPDGPDPVLDSYDAFLRGACGEC